MLVQSQGIGEVRWHLIISLVDYITELDLAMFRQPTTNSENVLKDIKAYFVLIEFQILAEPEIMNDPNDLILYGTL